MNGIQKRLYKKTNNNKTSNVFVNLEEECNHHEYVTCARLELIISYYHLVIESIFFILHFTHHFINQTLVGVQTD